MSQTDLILTPPPYQRDPPSSSSFLSSVPPYSSAPPSRCTPSPPPRYFPRSRSSSTIAASSSSSPSSSSSSSSYLHTSSRPRQRRTHTSRPTSGTSSPTWGMTSPSIPSLDPPPYSLTPPEHHIFFSKRANSSPHLRPTPTFNFYAPPPSATALNLNMSMFASAGVYRRTSAVSPADPHGNGTRCSSITSTPSDEDDAEELMINASPLSFAETLRARLLGVSKGKGRAEDDARPITTAPGIVGAGETETEGEDAPQNLPTARITPSALSPLALAAPSAQFVPYLFELFRLLSIVPAVFGTLYNLYQFVHQDGLDARVEWGVASLWSILTGWQCLMLTTGLLKRWRVYYSPLPTLIRLLALQALCWPATHLTLTILSADIRPLLCWALIGTTTCCSRAVQMWVTSNILPARPTSARPSSSRASSRAGSPGPAGPAAASEELRMGKRRKWDWGRVGTRCALPAGIVYFVMAWAVLLSRELGGC